MQLLEMRSGAFIAELVDESVSCEPEQAPSVAQEGSTAGVYEGSSIGVQRYPAQKRRRPRALQLRMTKTTMVCARRAAEYLWTSHWIRQLKTVRSKTFN